MISISYDSVRNALQEHSRLEIPNEVCKTIVAVMESSVKTVWLVQATVPIRNTFVQGISVTNQSCQGSLPDYKQLLTSK